MVQVSYPGVYIQEVSSGVRTITGVSTSIAAFLGRASQGPMNKAIRILSPSDYIRRFGAPHPKSDLANSVMQFFMNGGTDCYVIRVANGASKATVTLKSLQGEKVLVATAKSEGIWANTVRLEVDYNTLNPDETFNLRVIQENGGTAIATESYLGLSMNPSSPRFAPTFVSQSSDLIDLALASGLGDPKAPTSFINTLGNSFPGSSQGRRSLGVDDAAVRTTLNNLVNPTGAGSPKSQFSISVNDAPFVTVDLRPWTISMTATTTTIASDIQSKINDLIEPANSVTCSLTNVASVGFLLQITAASSDRTSVRVRQAATNDIAAALMLGIDRGGIEAVRWSNFRPAPTATFLMLGTVSTPGDLSNINAIAALTQNALTAIAIDGTSILLNADPYNLVTVPPGSTNRWYQDALPNSPNSNNDGVREKLGIIAAAINIQSSLPWRAEVWGYHLAILAKAAPGVTLNVQPTITTTPTTVATFNNTNLIANVRQYSLGTAGTGSFSTNGSQGIDGTAPDQNDYLGNPVAQTGLHALDPVDLFNLLVFPADEEVTEPTYTSFLGAANTYCQQRRAFLLIDAPLSWTKNGRPEVTNNTTLVNTLRGLLGEAKNHAAVFYPQIKYNAGGLVKLTGASGAIAGLMARTDSTRGVWKAPAGVEAGINGIVGLEVDLTDAENGVLNKIGVNCLRNFPSGFVNWGARTMAGSDDENSEWKYIPIRRLALFLEESLYRGTKWIVFEPNDEPLWAQIRLNLRAFMTGLFRQGAFQGSTPDKAFFVKCDGETTTQADRNLGIVNIEVGFAPLKPAEFVIIKIQQIAGDLQ
jgi:uncharacterized protein